MSNDRKTAVGVFEQLEQVNSAVEDLKKNGFTMDQIGFVMQNTSADDMEMASLHEHGEHEKTKYVEGSALLGGILGSMVGVLMVGVFPGLGPAVVGASLLTILGGGAVGGLVGALVGLGIPEDEAQIYHEKYEQGHALLTVTTDGRYSEALAILNDHGALDVTRPVEPAPVKDKS